MGTVPNYLRALLRIGLSGWVLLAMAGCGTDLPTSGQQVWGRNEAELELITIGSPISEIVADPKRPYVYATDFDRSVLYVIGRDSHQIERRLALGSRPSDLALDASGNRLYVALLGAAEVAVVDLDAGEQVDRIPLEFTPAYVVTGPDPSLFVSSTLDLADSFNDDGETRRFDLDRRVFDKVIPPVGLLEADGDRSHFYIATRDRIFQYDLTDLAKVRYLQQRETRGPIVDLHVSRDGQRVYTISAGELVTPEEVITHGLVDSRANVRIDMVEVFSVDGLIKIGELPTGAFPRAVTSDDRFIYVAASDAAGASHTAGFVMVFDVATLKRVTTYRLLGQPTHCIDVDTQAGVLYVAVDNPYDIRERFGDRQDVQVIPLQEFGSVDGDNVEPAPGAGAAARVKSASFPMPGGELEMIWIEPGSFMMGASEMMQEMMPFEGPRHEVTISRGFHLGTYEITQRQWEDVMGTKPWLGLPGVVDHPDHPAVFISWDDSQDLIAAMNDFEGLPLYRMPTEAEWEYACRARTTTSYSYGNNPELLGDYAWYRTNTWDSGKHFAQPVGVLLPNPWGLYDMHGNVWEWVHDWSGRYPEEPQIDPTGPETGRFRSTRSGIFMAGAMGQRSSFRYGGAQDFPDGGVGVRLLRQGR
ncbi:MAG TPA: SUMF1/EgtB/PvdO family nonheme iron enzyme [Candidatus Latescibacteria bacterium]|jgi:formylglycine-generating enzyme required for sulfatase activity|nr:hypothetical protein [Gemmatimonadaceae bacterium]HJP33573.1 SUMF1/EgtB/PvdO family nonheme iron enzyme [Candidatus Latescibacterota bacterium]